MNEQIKNHILDAIHSVEFLDGVTCEERLNHLINQLWRIIHDKEPLSSDDLKTTVIDVKRDSDIYRTLREQGEKDETIKTALSLYEEEDVDPIHLLLSLCTQLASQKRALIESRK